MINSNALTGSQAIDSQAPGQWLLWVRRVWIGLIVLLFIAFIDSIPGTYRMLQTVCDLSPEQCVSWAQPSSFTLEVLANYHISLQAFTIYNLTLYVAVSLFFWCAGLLVLRYRSRDWHGLVVSYLLITLATGGVSFVFFTDEGVLPGFTYIIIGLAIFPMYLAMSIFFQTFPDGKFYPKWGRMGTLLILANYGAWLAPGSLNIQNWPPFVMGLWLLLVFGFHIIGIQGYRYRYYYGVQQRQQTKWLILGAGISLVTTIVFNTFATPALAELLEGTGVALGFYLPIGIGITIALLRYRLWDVDVVINRTLVYGVLTAGLIGIYALIVGSLSELVNNDNSFIISLLGAGVIAVVFQPLLQRVQWAINRLMFGKRDEPLSVMVELGKSLEAMSSPDTALHHLVESTATALKLPYVGIERENNTEAVSAGKPTDNLQRFPLIYQAQDVGMLLVAPRSAGEALNTADRLVLENVAWQASHVVYGARLANDLQQSRQQILTTREEERRRLRRDLHDGLGPALATLTLQAEAAREWLENDPVRSEALLQEIIDGSQTILADIRRIVYALRPPALDDLGLVPAIREQANQYTINGLLVSVDAPESLPPLPAAVEVATYRIVQEALTNVSRHAKAHFCKVRLSLNGMMDIEIADDGVGIPQSFRSGVGLSSMHERAAELGGICRIESAPGSGTQIRVSLPR